MVWISSACALAIRSHAQRTYPNECCGALLGLDEEVADGVVAKPRRIFEALPAANLRTDSPRNRFSMSARDIIKAEREADARGLMIVGWYHSHPDHVARPSQYDRKNAWPWYSYVIVSVRGAIAEEMASWRLQDNRNEYWEEAIEIRVELSR
jgi:proteasome lid subunit RPN8/RPN11